VLPKSDRPAKLKQSCEEGLWATTRITHVCAGDVLLEASTLTLPKAGTLPSFIGCR